MIIEAYLGQSETSIVNVLHIAYYTFWTQTEPSDLLASSWSCKTNNSYISYNIRCDLSWESSIVKINQNLAYQLTIRRSKFCCENQIWTQNHWDGSIRNQDFFLLMAFTTRHPVKLNYAQGLWLILSKQLLMGMTHAYWRMDTLN